MLNNESVRCTPATMTALVGPSGSGKTTLLHCLGLLLPVSQGQILIDGKDVTKYGSAARRRFWRDHAAFVLQDYGIMESESIAFNVTMRSNPLGKRTSERLAQILDRIGLADRPEEAASHLSGGEKQRLAIARAVYKRAAVVFVDEPTASLDAINRRKVIDLLTEFATNGCTVVASTHDPELIEACNKHHEIGSGPAVA